MTEAVRDRECFRPCTSVQLEKIPEIGYALRVMLYNLTAARSGEIAERTPVACGAGDRPKNAQTNPIHFFTWRMRETTELTRRRSVALAKPQ